MKIIELVELIDIYNELEPNKSRCIDSDEIIAGIANLDNNKEIEFFISMIINRIDKLGA